MPLKNDQQTGTPLAAPPPLQQRTSGLDTLEARARSAERPRQAQNQPHAVVAYNGKKNRQEMKQYHQDTTRGRRGKKEARKRHPCTYVGSCTPPARFPSLLENSPLAAVRDASSCISCGLCSKHAAQKTTLQNTHEGRINRRANPPKRLQQLGHSAPPARFWAITAHARPTSENTPST